MDAKGIASSKIQFNLQNILGEEKKLLFVPDDTLLNKAHQYNTLPVLIYPVWLGVLRSLF